MRQKILNFKFSEWVFFVPLLIFSFYLMWKTFNLDSEGNMQIATKVWSDFAATIPLIRSFSFGNNLPPEYPIFAGPPIRYHFVFFYIVGMLEKLGVPLNLSLNIPSTFSFFFLLIMIYVLGKTIFKNKTVGVLSVIFFLFNGSWGFVEYFKTHPLSSNFLMDIISNDTFSSFGPYDGKIVSAFWSLNIFTNQRHLALAYLSFLALTLLYYKWSEQKNQPSYIHAVIIGILIGLFPFIHLAVYGMMGITLLVFLVIFPKLRITTLIIGVTAILVAVPQFLYMGRGDVTVKFFNPGFLVQERTFMGTLKYWFLNLGLITLLAPLGFVYTKKQQVKKMFLPFLALFITGNLFQLSTEVAANHKFFNLFIIGMNMFAAYFLVKLWSKKIVGKLLVIFIFPFMVLTGIIDLFPIINDRQITITDIPNNKAAYFIAENTNKDAVFLNAFFLYDPANLAGRKIYLGWPYFAWSAGYNTYERFNNMKYVFLNTNKQKACVFLKKEGVDFIEIKYPTPLEEMVINYSFYENNFVKVFNDEVENIRIYDVEASCNE